MLFEESGAFALDDGAIGDIPSLQLTINLKDESTIKATWLKDPAT